MTFSEKSSVGKLQSLSNALVSTSISPMGPSSSTKVPKGWSELIGYDGRELTVCLLKRHETYMTLDAGNKELVCIRIGVLHEVRRGLLSRDGDQGYTLVGGLEPDDLGPFDGTAGLVALVALPLTTLRLLFFLGGRRGRA